MYKVLLVSIASFFDSTGEIPFMFKRAGCKVDVFCDKSSWLLSNKYHDDWIQSTADESEFTSQLITLVRDKPDYYDWIVLLEDIVIKLCNELVAEEWIFKKLLPLTNMKNREILSSKLGLSNICNAYNIATPRFINYSVIADQNTISEKLSFPILLKEDFSFSGIGVHYCETPSHLKECLNKVLSTQNMVLQEFIAGDDIGVEALFKEGKLITYNAARILTYMYDRFSFTTRRKYYQSDEITSLLITLGESIGLNGFASIQYIYHPERKIYYLIEVDVRTNAWMPYSRFTANDFSAGIKNIMNGELSFIKDDQISQTQTEVVIFDRDIRRCIKDKDYWGLIKWMTNYKGCWKFIPWYDKKILARITKKLANDLSIKVVRHKKAA